PMTLVAARGGVEDDDAVVGVAVGDVELVRRWIDAGVGGPAQVVRVRIVSTGARLADLQEEAPRASELEDMAVLAAVAGEPHVVLMVDEDAVLAGRPVVADARA